MKNKYQALIEAIINDNNDEAKAIFHQIVIEKSRDIYESLMDEELGGNAADDFVGDISSDVDADEHGEEGLDGDDGMDDMDGDMDGDMDHNDDELTARIDDLEAEIEELRAQLGGEEGLDDMDHDEVDGDVDDVEDFHSGSGSASGSGAHDDSEFDADETFGESMSGSGMSGSGRSGSGRSGSGMSGSGKMESRRSELEIMREYVDKIGDIYKQQPAQGEGKTVGKGGDEPSVNKDSIVGPGADMGGEAKNIVNGGANKDPNGTTPNKGEENYGKKGRGMQPGAGQFMNVPGQDAGRKGFKSKASRDVGKKDSESGRTVGSGGDNPVVNKKSEIGGKVR